MVRVVALPLLTFCFDHVKECFKCALVFCFVCFLLLVLFFVCTLFCYLFVSWLLFVLLVLFWLALFLLFLYFFQDWRFLE